MLNGKEIIEKGIVFNNIEDKNIQQHGVDLNLIEVKQIIGNGKIRVDKTELPPLAPRPLDNGRWFLEPGVYDITFAQGCKVPKDQMLLIRQRSSLLRCGSIISSSIFDAGFQTENIGCVMVVNVPILIEYKARIAQIYNHQTSEVSNLYDGQFQNDKQRKDEKSKS